MYLNELWKMPRLKIDEDKLQHARMKFKYNFWITKKDFLVINWVKCPIFTHVSSGSDSAGGAQGHSKHGYILIIF